MRIRRLVTLGLVLLVSGLALALAVPTTGWFAWMGDDSLAAAVIASGRVFVMGAPQFVGLGAALAGLLAWRAPSGSGRGAVGKACRPPRPTAVGRPEEQAGR